MAYGFSNNEILAKIHATLALMGANIGNLGTFETAYAIWLVYQNPNYIECMTKRLYPAVAKHYDTEWKSVERNIRYVIRAIWEKNPQILGTNKKPTSKEFITMVMMQVRFHEQMGNLWFPFPDE